MRVLMVSTELWPLAKVGGLGDMVASLSRALRTMGHEVRCVLPAYASADSAVPPGTVVHDLGDVEVPDVTGSFRVGARALDGPGLPAPVVLIDHELFRRDGIYDDPATREGYADNGVRWAVFCRGVHAAVGIDGFEPDVIHGHDHQAGPLMGLLRWVGAPPRLRRGPATVFTVHNLGYHGIQPVSWLGHSGLPADLYYPTGPLEFHGNVNLMKIGIEAADRLTTVSPGYAREICSSHEAGAGLRDVVAGRQRALTGILNGIDTDVWDPSRDEHLPYRYSAERTAGKARNRSALRDELGLDAPATPAPLLAMVTRLTGQKGMDLVLPVLERVLDAGAQMAVLGSGEARYESALREAAFRHPGRLAVRIGFDEPLAHRIEAGADAFVMPSAYEPCGLNQMYSLRYGTVPVVRAVGGLADTVVDLDETPESANGFVFRLAEPVELFKTVHRALRAWRNRKLWKELMLRGMNADFSWGRSAEAYVRVYREALDDAGEAGVGNRDGTGTV